MVEYGLRRRVGYVKASRTLHLNNRRADAKGMVAVILAAGQGVRLRPLTDSIPKGLIKIGGKPLLRHSLANLSQAGIKNVIIVVGYRGEQIRQEIGNACDGVAITYIENSEYSKTGSMYSLLKTNAQIDNDILLLESDLFYEPRAVSSAAMSSEPNLILVADARGSGDEVYIEADKEGRLIDLGKGIAREKTIGELVGISRLSYDFLKRLFTTGETELESDPGISYEEVIAATAKRYMYRVHCLYVKGLLWTEIDNAHDLDEANQLAANLQSQRLRSPNSF